MFLFKYAILLQHVCGAAGRPEIDFQQHLGPRAAQNLVYTISSFLQIIITNQAQHHGKHCLAPMARSTVDTE